MDIKKKKITLISPCYNEVDNIDSLYERVLAVIDRIDGYDFEYIFIDNASVDGTVDKLREIAALDSRVRIIINNRNFGHIRSPYYGILQTYGDATIYLASDLQDPPEMIPNFIKGWESGYKLVMAVKPVAEDSGFMHKLRRFYYKTLAYISETPLTSDTTGFGLYDKCVVDELRRIQDPYPYLRGLIDELGYSMLRIEFVQPRRLRGVTKNNFFTLYDIAMLGVVSHSMMPLRVASIIGFIMSFIAFFASIFVLMLKVIWWEAFSPGLAPLVIMALFMFGVVMFFIGLMGEYIGSIHSYVKNRPIVTERERIGFDI